MSYRANPELEFVDNTFSQEDKDHVGNSIPLTRMGFGSEIQDRNGLKESSNLIQVSLVGCGSISLIFILGGLITYLYTLIPTW